MLEVGDPCPQSYEITCALLPTSLVEFHTTGGILRDIKEIWWPPNLQKLNLNLEVTTQDRISFPPSLTYIKHLTLYVQEYFHFQFSTSRYLRGG